MKKLILLSIFSSVIISQFLVLHEVRAELLYPVEIDYKPVSVRIYRITIQQDDKELTLRGLINRRSYNSHVLPGYIVYSVMDDKGQIIKEGVTNYSSSLSLRNKRYGSNFSFVLPDNLPEGSSIKLNWKKGHTGNI